MIRAGDIVKHKPSNEKWLVCGVFDGQVIPCGYPFPTIASIEDCELIEKGKGQTESMKRALLTHGLESFIEENEDGMERR